MIIRIYDRCSYCGAQNTIGNAETGFKEAWCSNCGTNWTSYLSLLIHPSIWCFELDYDPGGFIVLLESPKLEQIPFADLVLEILHRALLVKFGSQLSFSRQNMSFSGSYQHEGVEILRVSSYRVGLYEAGGVLSSEDSVTRTEILPWFAKLVQMVFLDELLPGTVGGLLNLRKQDSREVRICGLLLWIALRNFEGPAFAHEVFKERRALLENPLVPLREAVV